MKRVIISIFFVFCGFCPAVAKNMLVRVPVLNVRACPGTHCDILKKIHKNDKVKVENVSNGWAQIKLENDKTAYVLHKSLKKSYFYIWYYVIGIIILIILAELFEKKCGMCGKWNAMREYDRECIESRKSNMTKVAKTRYKNYTRTHEYIVPATLYRYKVTYRCKFCGHTVVKIEEEKTEN